MKSLVVGSTFSGVGGLDLGLEKAGHRVAFQCEFEPYRQRVLRRHWPDAELFADVREVGKKTFEGEIDLLCGGFPCQDLSVAGKRRGLAGKRSSLFFEFARIADELVRSGGWVLVENVPGLLSGCSCVGCEECRELLRLHSRGWSRLGRNTGRDPRGDGSQLGFADGLAGGSGLEEGADPARPDASRRGAGRCPCRRCDAARSLLVAHDGTEFSVVRSVLGEIGFHDLAWRVLDSRYLGVPQRRRRVFILARRARGRRAAEVLLEPEGGGGDFEASREARSRVAAPLTRGSSTPGVSPSGRRQEDDVNIVNALDRKGGGADDNEAQAGHLIAGTVRSHVRPGSNDVGGIVGGITRRYGKGSDSDATDAFVAHTLRAEGFDASEDGTGRGTPLVGGDPQGPEGEGRRGDRPGGDADPQGVRGNGGGSETNPDGVREAAGLPGRMDLGNSCAFDPLPDGPRYSACGDAVTVNVAGWIGRRLAELA